MEWSDRGIVLGNRAHGENHSIAVLFTEQHGAVSGLVHGGQGKTRGAIVQPGNSVTATWKGRTDEQLGHFSLDLEQAHAALAMSDRTALLGLTAVTDLLRVCLPENQPYPSLFAATEAVLHHLDDMQIWSILLVKWELGVLEQLGFGLTLDRCVATGQSLEDGAELVFVSPKSGGAVSYQAGLPYKDRMLPLPPFVIGQGEPTHGDVKAALELTGYFLAERLLAPAGKTPSDSRDRLVDRLFRGKV